jgi:hypothetical protein
MTTYKIQKVYLDGIPAMIMRSDGILFPQAEDNSDYQAYLKWLSEGNQPEPADAPTV